MRSARTGRALAWRGDWGFRPPVVGDPRPRAVCRRSSLSPTTSVRRYLLRLTRSWSISSEVLITRELAWKPRWAVIMVVNVWARSTLDISTAPAVVKPKLGPGAPTVAGPEFALSSQRLEPERSRP